MLNIKKYLFKVLSTPFIDYIFNKLRIISLRAMNYGNGGEYTLSGEIELVKRLFDNVASNSIVFFDVGANNGSYALEVIQAIGQRIREYHCFEPALNTRQLLSQRISNHLNIFIHDFALSNCNGSKQLLSSSHSSGLSTLYQRDLRHHSIEYDSSEFVRTVTLDSFCEHNDIQKIDFLKMDIEGHELAALEGAIKMIKAKKISFIQFEFGGCNIDSRTFLKDFYDLLSDNYDLYRIQRYSIVKMSEYSEDLENFLTTNYLAKLK